MEQANNVNLLLLVAIVIIGVMMWQWLIALLYVFFLLSFVAIPFTIMIRANKALKKYNNN